MIYEGEQTKRARRNVSYTPKPLDLSQLNVKHSKSKPKMTTSEEEDYFIKNTYMAKKSLEEPELPPLTWSNWYKQVDWVKTIVLGTEPFIALYGIFTTTLTWQTALFAFTWGWLTGLGITAGYHRLFTHRSYEASKPLRWVLLMLGAGAFQGSALWWSHGHRAHHRYTDTELDPYNARKGLFHSHIGWLLMKPRRKIGYVDMSDLERDPAIQWQRRHIFILNWIVGVFVPYFVCGFGWGDYRGGYFYGAMFRLVIVHHATFCVNSLAHYLGDTPFDDRHTPRDHFVTAIVTLGEGYHNFHHEFPCDYRNAVKWYQYDPTKWAISIFEKVGLAHSLKRFPENEILKGRFVMQKKALDAFGQEILWPKDDSKLPIVSFEEYQELANQETDRELVLIAGYVHDVSNFIDSHPGGRALLKSQVGKDATAAFYGGVQDHSNAAHNTLAMMRVAICKQGGQVECLEKEPRYSARSNPVSG